MMVLKEPHTLILSTAILDEARRVFKYPHVQKRWPLADAVIETYLSLLETAAFMIDLPTQAPAVLSDPDDDPILQTAILGQADILCTRDGAFSRGLVVEICRAQGIDVLDDVALARKLRLGASLSPAK
jgi:putative PIN family toxin of toxin-antitoxin system